MKKKLTVLILIFVMVIGSSCSKKELNVADEKPLSTAEEVPIVFKTEEAKQYVMLFTSGKFAEAIDAVTYDKAMNAAFNEAVMKSTRDQMMAQYGDVVEIKGSKITQAGKMTIYSIGVIHEKKTTIYNVVYNEAGEVAGFNYQEIESIESFFEIEDLENEIEVAFGSDDYPIIGTLTLPKGEGPFPAVVLVHGSGPNDRDSTIFTNKPFKDLAKGLAEQGIAVLRYDKRTFLHAEKMQVENDITIYTETVDDAVLAYRFLKNRPEISSDKIYVFGHSLGANQAPRIANAEPDIDGIILYGGFVTPLHELMLYQVKYLSELTPGITDEEQAQIDLFQKMVDTINGDDYSEKTDPALTLNLPYDYLKDIVAYNPIEEAKKLACPILIIQGGRDYQVPVSEFIQMRTGLKDKADFLSYDALNHIMMSGEGISSPDEYMNPSHVDDGLIKDIANWIKNH